MPFELTLPRLLAARGWKVKIRELERLEPPHVTILRRTTTWRFALRDARFLDRRPPARDVPADLIAHLCEHLDELRRAWDAMYPENPVGGDR